MKTLADLKIILRGGGDLATGVALRLYRSGLKRLLILETEHPLAVRQMVAFSQAVRLGEFSVEGVTASHIDTVASLGTREGNGAIPILADPAGKSIQTLQPDIVIDAIIAKRNTGTAIDDAALVIGLGPGFTAGVDVDCVVETMRGHTMGRVIHKGSALADTGIPGIVGGYSHERLLRAPGAGLFTTNHSIGDRVQKEDQLGTVDSLPVVAKISGVVRGLLNTDTPVAKGTKLGDIDPRNQIDFCATSSDKAMAVGGGVLEAILWHYHGRSTPHNNS